MKKIIAALDGLKYSPSTADYAVQLSKMMNAHLVGVFLDDFTRHSYKVYELIHGEEGFPDEKMRELDEHDKELRHVAVTQFEATCREAGINHTIHHDRNIAIQELLHESLYADLLIIDSKETSTAYSENLPTRFVRDLLIHVECPVLLVPQHFLPLKKIVLLYDGEPASIYAIKMFSYLFQPLKDMQVELVTVKLAGESAHLPENRLMKEFMKRHFPNAEVTVLKGLPDVEIVNHLKYKQQDELIVLGAYTRGMVSRWLKPSMADVLMQEMKSPLFVAHNGR